MEKRYFNTKEEAEAFAKRCYGSVFGLSDGRYMVKFYWDDLMFD